jgi:hypothetical protein
MWFWQWCRTPNHWVSGLCKSSRILNNYKTQLSIELTSITGKLNLRDPTEYVSPSLHKKMKTGSSFCLWFSSYLEFHTLDKVKNMLTYISFPANHKHILCIKPKILQTTVLTISIQHSIYSYNRVPQSLVLGYQHLAKHTQSSANIILILNTFAIHSCISIFQWLINTNHSNLLKHNSSLVG